MRRKVTFGLLTAAAVCFAGAPAFAQQSLSIAGSSTVQGTGSATFTIEMTNTSPVEGFVIAIGYDNGAVTIDSVDRTALTNMTDAELFVPEILATGFTLGVVMDSGPPFGGQTIAPGTDQAIAIFTASSDLIFPLGDPDVVTGFNFVDGTLNNPPLDNIIVQGGQSIGSGQGLGLTDAPNALTIQGIPPATLTIGNGSAAGNATGCVSIELDNDVGATQGFVLSISHDENALDLVDINFDGTASEMWIVAGTGELEFQAINIYPNGGTVGAVFDFDPMTGPANPVIPAGQDNLIANFCYTCDNPVFYPLDGSPPPPSMTTDLTFVDNVFGSPLLSNVIVVGGQSISPNLTNGTFECIPVGVPVEDTAFYCGPADFEGSAPGTVADPIKGTEGEMVEICFFYSDPTDNLQGVQIATCHDCALEFTGFDISGSIFDEVGAEFVNAQFDNDPAGGCHMYVGILLDALPPFDNQTVPPTSTPLLIGCATATIGAGTCGTNLMVEFCDTTNDNGVLIENIAVIDFESIQNFETNPCMVMVVPEEIIQRGDCNTDDKVDLADAATVLGWQFQGLAIDCPDACDANDDGKINLADSVLIMNYLFMGGMAPADPGPIDGMEGADPTEDNLGPCVTMDGAC
jgi:precorrin-6B methylase 2